MPEWLMGADCKSADGCLRWFKSSSAQFVCSNESLSCWLLGWLRLYFSTMFYTWHKIIYKLCFSKILISITSHTFLWKQSHYIFIYNVCIVLTLSLPKVTKCKVQCWLRLYDSTMLWKRRELRFLSIKSQFLCVVRLASLRCLEGDLVQFVLLHLSGSFQISYHLPKSVRIRGVSFSVISSLLFDKF